MSRKLLIFLFVFLVLRILLFNINISEWGDSYYIIKAAESLRSNFSYPAYEKRLPLLSALIALNPLPVEMVVWAKILQILLSAGIILLTFKLARRLFPDLDTFALYTLSFALLFNPVFFYWSLRVVAGILFTFLCLLAFNIYHSQLRRRFLLLGLVCGLASLTRYEGFLLTTAFGLSLLLAKKFKPLILHSLFFILIISPWFLRNYLIFGNPFHSTYFSEPSTYTYNLKTVLIFLVSLVFLFGFPPVFFFVERGCRRVVRGPLFIFILLELLLILCWPAAVPRLFLPLIPFFLIFLVGGLAGVGVGERKKLFAASLVLTLVYVLSQYFLRLHFLVLSKSGLTLIATLGLLSTLSWLVFDFERARRIFVGLLLASEMIASFVVINNHRLVYSDALRAAQFAASLDGLTAYSDETGVVKYYLGDKGRKLPDDLREAGQQWRWLQENEIEYVLATDEYEQLSRFNAFNSADYADKFVLVKSWEVEVADAFDSFLMRKGIFPKREYPIKHSWVYKVLR